MMKARHPPVLRGEISSEEDFEVESEKRAVVLAALVRWYSLSQTRELLTIVPLSRIVDR